MVTAAGAVDGDDELIGSASDPDAIFVGRSAELEQGLAALRIGHSVLIKGQPGIGKRSLLREVRIRLAEERTCLCPTLATPKTFVAELAEQVHHAVGLTVPERLIPPRFRAEAERTGRIAWKHIQRTIVRLPAQEVILLVLNSLEGREDVVLFVESLEVPPSQADMLNSPSIVRSRPESRLRTGATRSCDCCGDFRSRSSSSR